MRRDRCPLELAGHGHWMAGCVAELPVGRTDDRARSRLELTPGGHVVGVDLQVDGARIRREAKLRPALLHHPRKLRERGRLTQASDQRASYPHHRIIEGPVDPHAFLRWLD